MKKEKEPPNNRPSNADTPSLTVTPATLESDTDKARLSAIDTELKQRLKELQESRDGRRCYPFLLYKTSITDRVVEDVFDELRKEFNNCGDELDVLVFSSGGDIDAAYNLALLFRKYAHKRLTFIIGRWAKSAATLLVCGGDEILMSPIAELGPLDPQITEINPLEQRMERFSPLHIEATLNLIREEFNKGHEKLATGLLERLQFPLTLGSFKKSLDLGKEYTLRLLSTRMFKDDEGNKKATAIADKLSSGYADHSFCIEIDEARAIGLNAHELADKPLDIVWAIHRLCREKEEIKEKQKKKDLEDLLKSMPPDLRKEKVPNGQRGKPNCAKS